MSSQTRRVTWSMVCTHSGRPEQAPRSSGGDSGTTSSCLAAGTAQSLFRLPLMVAEGHSRDLNPVRARLAETPEASEFTNHRNARSRAFPQVHLPADRLRNDEPSALVQSDSCFHGWQRTACSFAPCSFAPCSFALSSAFARVRVAPLFSRNHRVPASDPTLVSKATCQLSVTAAALAF